MHLEVRDRADYNHLVRAGVPKSTAYSIVYYHEIGWKSMNVRNRLEVIRYRTVSPPLCPACGSTSTLFVYNISKEYRDDDTDYKWLCRSCGILLTKYQKEPGTSRRLLRRKRKEALEPAPDKHLFGRFL